VSPKNGLRFWVPVAYVVASAVMAFTVGVPTSHDLVFVWFAFGMAAFSITDGVDLWARALIARESSVQDVAITPRTSTVVAGRTVPLSGYPILTTEDAERAKNEVPGVAQYALTLTGSARVEYLDRRATALLTLSTASLADSGTSD